MKNNNRTKKTNFVSACQYVLILMLSGPNMATAQDTTGPTANLKVQSVQTDNARAQTDDRAESDDILILGPELTALWRVGKSRFMLGYVGDYAFYSDDDELDYEDHAFSGSARFDHSRIFGSDFSIGYIRDHDTIGSTEKLGTDSGGVDTWSNLDFMAVGTIGRTYSRGQIVGRLRFDERRFLNNNQESRDYDRVTAVATYFHRVTAKTRILIEGQVADFEYPNDTLLGFNQTNTTYRALTGVNWAVSEATSGSFKIGYLDKRYDDPNIADVDGLTFILDGKWQPNSFTALTFGGQRADQEGVNAINAGFVRTQVFLQARRDVSSRFAIFGEVRVATDDFNDSRDREDDRLLANVGVKSTT